MSATGLEAMKHYYNSVASFEGEWYMFIMDANDIYIVHPLLPHLIGTDLKDVVGADGYELGKAIVKAADADNWVDYLWPHPATLQDAPKVAYAVRHDGLIFASGYYPVEDARAKTEAYVAEAIAMYDRDGLDATVAYYNSEESIDGQFYLFLVDANETIRTSPNFPDYVGLDYTDYKEKFTTNEISVLTATEEGQWFQVSVYNPHTPEDDLRHIWAGAARRADLLVEVTSQPSRRLGTFVCDFHNAVGGSERCPLHSQRRPSLLGGPPFFM